LWICGSVDLKTGFS